MRAMANREIAAHAQGFFKTGPGDYGEGDLFLGIRMPNIRAVVKQYQALEFAQVVSLLQSKYHEERLCAALLLVQKFQKAQHDKTRKQVYQTYLENTHCINNWDIVDCSAHKIVGAYLLTRNRAVLKKLAASKNLWERRIAVMATLHFIQHNEFADTLSLAEKLLNDKEDLIHKIVGWMLREIGKRAKPIEIDFLDKHCTVMPRTMLRYAIEKFTPNERKAYLNAGKS